MPRPGSRVPGAASREPRYQAEPHRYSASVNGARQVGRFQGCEGVVMSVLIGVPCTDRHEMRLDRGPDGPRNTANGSVPFRHAEHTSWRRWRGPPAIGTGKGTGPGATGRAHTPVMTGMAMYDELAPWFHLLTPPSDYMDDAEVVMTQLRSSVDGPLGTLLELGSGGGNTASHLSRDLRLTLADVSPDMLALSRTINPDSEHLVGDMRHLRLGRTFDAVLIHDAICYMTTEADLRAAMLTAWVHLRPGGAVVLMPDHVRETFRTGTDDGGEDDPAGAAGGLPRGLRFLEWTTDPDPTDTTYQVDYAIMLRDSDGTVRLRHDRHIEGLFSRQTWLDLMAGVGLVARAVISPAGLDVFVGQRPAPGG